MEIKYHNEDKIPLEDKMLLSLYRKYLDNGNDGYFRLSATISDNVYWRNVADRLHEKSFIEYPDSLSLSTIGRITQEGINHIKKTYG